MPIISYVAIYALSIAGGWLIVASCLNLIRLTVNLPREFSRWIDFWVGGTERAVATTLVALAPTYLPAFIGAWVAFKLAANWQRKSYRPQVAQGTLIALIGSVLSFSIAIAAGLLIRPDALAIWSMATKG